MSGFAGQLGDNALVFKRRQQPKRVNEGIAVVVFACPAKDLTQFAVATGPCVPLPGQSRALCSPLSQDTGETPEQTTALYTALTGRPASEAMMPLDEAGAGLLSRCSDEFVAAMAAANDHSLKLADQDEARGDSDLTSFTAYQDELSRTWMQATVWPRSVVGLHNRLTRLAWAQVSQEKGLPLYAWHGPSAPQFVLVERTGPYPGRGR